MHRRWFAVVFLLLAPSANAGVYNLQERHEIGGTAKMRGYYLDVRSISVDPLAAGKPLRPESPRAAVLRQVEALKGEFAARTFSTLDRVNLAACYLRLGGERVPEAIGLLNRGDQSHFLIQSNLAAAYFLSGETAMAVRHQTRAVDLWPEIFSHWTEQELRFYRECEQYLLKLYRSRDEEARGGRLRGPVEVDPFFPGLRFVSSRGYYEAGELAPAMRDRLPTNGFNVLYMILLWFPTDMRLYWLFGELLNAAGAVDQAADVFVELVESGTAGSFKDLPRHRRVLVEAKPAYLKFRDPMTQAHLLAATMIVPRPMLAPPGLGDAAYLVSTGAAAVFATQGQQPDPNDFVPTTPSGPPQQVFNFGHIAIGFGFGFVAAGLLAMQWAEWRRRRPRSEPPPREDREPVSLHPPSGPSTSIRPGG